MWLTLALSSVSALAQPADYGAQPGPARSTVVEMPGPRASADAPAPGVIEDRLDSTAAPQTPPRGMRMTAVVSRYGEPLRRHAAIGQPPITRWDYPDYRLYFEYDHVLHAVVPQSPVPIAHTAQLEHAP
ncbi:hypothetical protein T31B1_08898 [Salinisphaera sp. T31B1]